MVTNQTGVPAGNTNLDAAPVSVVEADSLGAAAELIGAHDLTNPCVLNFASDTNQGGGVKKGNQTGTQEESLCRCTSLLASLEALEYPIPHQGLAYTPDILVIRDHNYQLLTQPFRIACVSASLRPVNWSSATDREFVDSKIRCLLTVALNQGHYIKTST